VEPIHELNRRRVTPALRFAQALLGLAAYGFLALPYLRRVHGIGRLDRRQRYLFVSNHVSLLDTILLGAIVWRAGCYPILVLGDKKVWHASWIKRALSSKIGFLLERGRLNPNRIEELLEFGRLGREFHLLVFPEGTRGDGVNVAECQPGLHYIALEARLPIVPVFIENMQLLSTKTGPLHVLGALRKVEVHIGEAIPPEQYAPLPREEFLARIRTVIAAARSGRGVG
jgi:1-acyl-sn-glycerol-3-phosphate acyltransferase